MAVRANRLDLMVAAAVYVTAARPQIKEVV
jgi:hypothetical protein